jgi:hypothetical protein
MVDLLAISEHGHHGIEAPVVFDGQSDVSFFPPKASGDIILNSEKDTNLVMRM